MQESTMLRVLDLVKDCEGACARREREREKCLSWGIIEVYQKLNCDKCELECALTAFGIVQRLQIKVELF